MFKPRIQSAINMIWKPRKKNFFSEKISVLIPLYGVIYLQFSFHRPNEIKEVNGLHEVVISK